MWKIIKEHITNKCFWLGFCEGFLIFPLLFDKRLYRLLIRKDLNND